MIAAEELAQSSISPAVRVFHGKRAAGYAWLPWEVRGGAINFEWPLHSFDLFSLGALWLELQIGRVEARQVISRLAAKEEWSQAVSHISTSRLPSTFASVMNHLLGPAADRPPPGLIRQDLERLSVLRSDESDDQAVHDVKYGAQQLSTSVPEKRSTASNNGGQGTRRGRPRKSEPTQISKLDSEAASPSENSKKRSCPSAPPSKAKAQKASCPMSITPVKQSQNQRGKSDDCVRTIQDVQPLENIGKLSGQLTVHPRASELYLAKVELDRLQTDLLHLLGNLHEDKCGLGSRVMFLLEEVQQCRKEAIACQSPSRMNKPASEEHGTPWMHDVASRCILAGA
jgi:hypothetical protein